MSRMIKDFDSFREDMVNEEFNLSSIGDFFGGIATFAGAGLTKTIKQKIVASLMEKFGVEENSLFSGILQEVVDDIPIKDYPSIFTGENANVEYLAPRMSGAIQELIQRKGLDGIAQQIGLKTDGLLYSIIREGIQDSIKTGKAKKVIEDMLIAVFGGENAKGSVARDAIASLDPRDKNQLADAVKKKADKFYGKTDSKQSEEGFGDYISSFWNVLTGNKQTS